MELSIVVRFIKLSYPYVAKWFYPIYDRASYLFTKYVLYFFA